MKKLGPFKGFLQDRCGLIFEDEREDSLEKAIALRMAESNHPSPESYYNFLRRDNEEFVSLISRLTINETYFRREPHHFELLTGKLIPEREKEKNGEKIKILCAGCATGEEAYSVAMEICDARGEKALDRIELYGIDIDREAVEKAKAGRFGKNSFRGGEKSWRSSYFSKEDDGLYRISEIFRKRVTFLPVNLIGDPFPSYLHDIDFIFYRNVSIYFNAVTRSTIFQKLSLLLAPRGYLFTGTAETYCHNLGILTLVEKEGVFCYQKGGFLSIQDRRLLFDDLEGEDSLGPVVRLSDRCQPIGENQDEGAKEEKLSRESGQRAREDWKNRRKPNPFFDRTLALAVSRRYDQALERIDKITVTEPSFLKAQALKAGLFINMNRLDEAREIAEEIVKKEPLQMEGYLYLGLVAKIRQEPEDAEKKLKEALYVEPSCWIAHFYLAEIYLNSDEKEAAAREYRITLSLLEKGDILRLSLALFPLSFPADQMVNICRHNLEKLQTSKRGGRES